MSFFTKPLVLYSILILLFNSAYSQDKVLFIRGGTGTVGGLEPNYSPKDDQAADIYYTATTTKNHNWSMFADDLRDEGYELTQMKEGPVSDRSPVDLTSINIRQYALVVFGSNNATYTTAQIDTLESYIKDGGAALFISDANFGLVRQDAPNSDQLFLNRFGWTMNQDGRTYTVGANEFKAPNHTILEGVNTFKGEGVSPITLSNNNIPGVQSTIIAGVPNGQKVRENPGNKKGDLRNKTDKDATLIVATVGKGRIIGHFDRNTFFNTNGAGTDITEFNNRQLGINIVNWATQKNTVGIENNLTMENGILVYPNPVSDMLMVELVSQGSTIKIIDLQGRIVKSMQTNNLAIEIPVDNLPHGQYIVQVISANTFWSDKIIIR